MTDRYASEEWARLERTWTAADPLRAPETDEEPYELVIETPPDGRVAAGWLLVVAVLGFCAGVVVGRWA